MNAHIDLSVEPTAALPAKEQGQFRAAEILKAQGSCNHDWPVASAVATVLLVLLVGPIAVYQYYQGKEVEA